MEDAPFDTQKTDDGETDGIGAVGSPDGKNPMLLTVEEWDTSEAGVGCTMKVEEKDDVGESVKIHQTVNILRVNLYCPMDVFSGSWLDGCSLGFGERGVDDTDGIEKDRTHNIHYSRIPLS